MAVLAIPRLALRDSEPEVAAPSSDEALVAAAAAGSRDAFGELLRRHEHKVRAMLLRLCGDRTLADDLAQEAFLRAYRGLVGFERRAAFSTWLYRIAYNAYLSHSGRKNTAAKVEAGLRQQHAAVWTHAPVDAPSDLRQDLELAIAELPERYRVVVLLYYCEGVNYPEIAEILELPVGTVKTHLHRAKRALRERLTGWER